MVAIWRWQGVAILGALTSLGGVPHEGTHAAVGPAIAPADQSPAEASKTSPAALSARADEAMAAGKHAEAAEWFERLTDAAPKSPRAWAGLVRSYDQEGRRSYGELVRVAPKSPYVSLIVADALAAVGKLPEAFALYRKVEAALPKHPGLHEAVADVYDKAGHADWAARERARTAVPDCARPSAACTFLTGDFRDTLQRTKNAQADEDWYWRVRALNQLATRALAALERLPPSVELHTVRASLAESQNRPQAAVDELRAALELTPGDRTLERRLATALYLAHDHEAMLPITQQLLAKTPDDPELQFLHGSALLEAQQIERAIPPLERAVAADPSLLQARAALGRAFVMQGKMAAAIPHLEAALPSDRDGNLYYQLAQAYQRTGRRDQARAALEKYQALRQRAETTTVATGAAPTITPP
ncbi:MAG: tetratricopeptide repeat protein [Vicinamibacteraceae bacterium]